jgi:hypothetical protein
MDIAPSGCVDDAPHPFDPPDAMSPDAMLDTEAWRTESPAIAVERLLRGLRAATRRVDDVEQEANRLRSHVAAWVDERTRSDRDRISRYRGALQWIVGDYREATGTAKISTPSGAVTHRRGTAPKVEVVDESAVLRWVVDTLDPVVVERVARLKLSRDALREGAHRGAARRRSHRCGPGDRHRVPWGAGVRPDRRHRGVVADHR